MSCELQFELAGSSDRASIADLRKMCEADPSIDLRDRLKGGRMRVIWPHARPQPTGQVRAKLIHDRMHKRQLEEFGFRENPGTALANLSTIFTLIITIPAVAFSLYKLCQWFKLEETTSKLIAVLGGVLSFLVEMTLVFIETWKTERHQRKLVRLGIAPPK